MADVIGPGAYRAQTSVPITGYKNAEAQQREFDRQLKDTLESIRGEKSADESIAAGVEGDSRAQRQAARLQRVEQTGLQEKVSRQNSEYSPDKGTPRGSRIDLEA